MILVALAVVICFLALTRWRRLQGTPTLDRYLSLNVKAILSNTTAHDSIASPF